jgi:hypothetical protein
MSNFIGDTTLQGYGVLYNHYYNSPSEEDKAVGKRLYETYTTPVDRIPVVTNYDKINHFNILRQVVPFNSTAKPDFSQLAYKETNETKVYNDLGKKRMARFADARVNYISGGDDINVHHTHKPKENLLGDLYGIPAVTQKYFLNEFRDEDQPIVNKDYHTAMLYNCV